VSKVRATFFFFFFFFFFSVHVLGWGAMAQKMFWKVNSVLIVSFLWSSPCKMFTCYTCDPLSFTLVWILPFMFFTLPPQPHHWPCQIIHALTKKWPFNHLGGGPVVRAWDQEVCSLYGFRFEPCGCSYDSHCRLTWSLTSEPVRLVEVRASWPGHPR
jgi:hypothetical protein